jgi:CDP-diacylglycerol---glycerol-3-phosphate 3-phosphatidyltransferase
VAGPTDLLTEAEKRRGRSRLNPANVITLIRILAVPAVVWLLFGPGGKEISAARSAMAFTLFVFASVTDLFDGYIARRYGMVTSLGKLLDPLADKLLLCAAIIMLIPAGRVPAWMVVIVVAREIGVTALRGAASSEGLVIAASSLGKAKTLILNIGVAALILHYPVILGVSAHTVGMWFLGAGLILTTWSGLDYFFRFVGELFNK